MKLQGCDSLQNLYVGDSAKYTSTEVVKEMQGVLSKCIKLDIHDELHKNHYFGLMVDESTDVSTHKRPYSVCSLDSKWYMYQKDKIFR